MRAITVTQKGMTKDEKRIVDAFILSDTDPETLPENGANVIGMTENDIFAPFSMILVLAGMKVYIANESGHFVATS